jgi:DNA (cytosine-5)-methyltransferase 3A
MLPKDIFMVIGGSPCQGFSIAGRKKGMVAIDDLETIEVTSLFQYMNLKESGFQFEGESYLFWEFIRLIKMTKPKYFLLENVLMKGQNKKWEKIISKELGVEPILINSSLITAQNRERLYWTNITGITIPEDLNIMLSDVVEGAVSGYGKSGVAIKGEIKPGDKKYYYPGSIRKDFKANCLTKGGNRRKYVDTTGVVHELTVEHCEVLQGVPVGYTDVLGVPATERHKMLGNGWTVPVIEHIFSFIPEFELVEV